MIATSETSERTHKAKRDVVRFTVDGERVIRMDPSDTHQTFRVVEGEPVGAYTRTPTVGRLPGFGTQYDTCGQRKHHFCSECGHIPRDGDGEPVTRGDTCWRKECPRCGSGWAMRATIKGTAKIESKRQEVAAKRRPGAAPPSPRFHHVIVSMPFFKSAGDPDKAFKDVVKGVIEEVSLEGYGGMMAHHSYSGEDGDDIGIWKTRLFNDRDWEDVRGELKEWHHAHCIVLADEVRHDLCKAVYEQTGIVTHRILQTRWDDDEEVEFEKEALYKDDGKKRKSNVSLYNEYDLASATSYFLSHARDADDAWAYEYFGAVANHKAPATKKAQMRRVTRAVVPRTLDLNVHDVTCDNDATEEDAEAYSSQFDSDGVGGSEDDSEDGSGAKCSGRLVPMEYAEKFLEERDLPRASELREFLESEWDGPPD